MSSQSFATSAISAINLDAYIDLMEVSEVVETIDLESSLIHKAIHPKHGIIFLVNTAGDKHGLIYAS